MHVYWRHWLSRTLSVLVKGRKGQRGKVCGRGGLHLDMLVSGSSWEIFCPLFKARMPVLTVAAEAIK